LGIGGWGLGVGAHTQYPKAPTPKPPTPYPNAKKNFFLKFKIILI